ncbi:uncharacterized protein LOC129761880 isoform X2 [Toxorhynchites rutilus septentrionalis]|nr:uncharacterized protein LOC129761880 isoform X2 [Toxorhynchites rutilus septentrionalis]
MCLDGVNGPAELPVVSSQHHLEELARSELNSDDVSITLSAGSAKGDNYIGIVFRARVECRQTGKHKNIIVKLPPQSEARRNQFFARPSFEREICFYTEIYPMMVKFQLEKGIELDDGTNGGFNQIPRCLRTSLVEREEAIFMTDLKEAGFDMFDRHQLQGIEHHRLLVKTLGRFHAISFALKDQQPELIAPYQGMMELFATREDDGSLDTWFTMLIERTLGTLDEQEEPEVYSKTKAALEGKFMDMIIDLTKGENAEPYAVICHGDCWNNNMLFKSENGIPVDIRLLDWQICRYASPVLDLMYFIFTASTKEFRELHYEHLLDLYYESLADFLRRLGSDPEKLFPRKALDEQLQRFGRFGLMMAVMLLPVINTKSEDVPDLEEMSEKLESGADVTENINNFRSEETEGIYREKMSGCCRDMVRLGYI